MDGLYGSANDGDMATRRARARINDEVQGHFRSGGCGPMDVAEWAGCITCPTLILAGEDDPVSPAAAAMRLAASLCNSPVQVETLPGAGHGVFRQAPQPAFGLLRSFLRQVAPSD